jgi:hypothetical protein
MRRKPIKHIGRESSQYLIFNSHKSFIKAAKKPLLEHTSTGKVSVRNEQVFATVA